MLFFLLSALGLVHTFQKSKCKKLLFLTMERIKVLEKRRQARVRQLYRDVIELLLLKKEDKVDPLLVRIWKELCLFSVYAKIAEYCGFVQISLNDIAGQRECPSGLEEPLAGLCFAASCCADLPELQDLREILAMKFGKQIVSSGQDLEPNCHVNHLLLDCLYAKDPLKAQKLTVLEDIVTKYKAMQGHDRETQHRELHGSTEFSMYRCNEWKEGNDNTEAPDVQHQCEYGVSQDVDVMHERNHGETVCKEVLVSTELGNELASRKRTFVEGTELSCCAFERALRRRRSWLNKAMEGGEKGGNEHGLRCAEKLDDSGNGVCRSAGKQSAIEWFDVHISCSEDGISAHIKDVMDLHILSCIEQPTSTQPPQRPPPPPPQRAPPPPPCLQVMPMPSFQIDKQARANENRPRRSSTMANEYYLESFGSHVHPKLPQYEDLVASFTALKR